MRTSIPINNFAHGQIDRDLKGRFDLPLTQNGLELIRNFYPTIKGNVMYRTGFEFLNEIGYSALYEFKFNEEQSYLLVFTPLVIKFYSYDSTGEFIQVLNPSNTPLEVAHNWGTEVFNLDMDQNGDVLYITHKKSKYLEYKLTRTASNAFNLAATVYTGASFGAAETVGHGFPGLVKFYENRLNRARSSKYSTYLYGSKGGAYDNLTIGTNTNDGYQFDLAEAISPILWLISGQNSLIAGTQEGIMTINGGSVDKAITPDSISAKMSCKDGCCDVKPISKDEFVLYVSQNQRAIYAFSYDVLYELFKATNLSKANYEITKGNIKKLAYKIDRHNFIYAICGGKLLSITFSNDEGINGWAVHDTDGEFVDMCTVTRPDGETDLFVNIKRTINGLTRYYLERLTDYVEFSRFEDFVTMVDSSMPEIEKREQKKQDKWAFYRTIAEELKQCVHLDSSIRYDGLETSTITFNSANNTITCSESIFQNSDIGRRIWYKTLTGREYGIFDIVGFISGTQVTVDVVQAPTQNSINKWYFSATIFSGLTHLEGETVGVVGNGGYLGDFVVSGGKVDISSANVNKVGSAVIGLKYTGLLKSCNLGLAVQETQTHTTPKNLYKMVLRLNFSAGGKFGDDLYDLVDIQDFNPDGLYNIPPLPMDGDVEIPYSGEFDKDKHYFIVQDSPLPFQMAMAVPYYKHVTNT